MKLNQELIDQLRRVARLNELPVDRFADEERVVQGMRGPFVAEVDGIPKYLGAYQTFLVDPETQEILLAGFDSPSRGMLFTFGSPESVEIIGDCVVMLTSGEGYRNRLQFRPFEDVDWEWVDPNDNTDKDWEGMVASIAEYYRTVDAGEDFSLPDDDDDDDEDEDEDDET